MRLTEWKNYRIIAAWRWNFVKWKLITQRILAVENGSRIVKAMLKNIYRRFVLRSKGHKKTWHYQKKENNFSTVFKRLLDYQPFRLCKGFNLHNKSMSSATKISHNFHLKMIYMYILFLSYIMRSNSVTLIADCWTHLSLYTYPIHPWAVSKEPLIRRVCPYFLSVLQSDNNFSNKVYILGHKYVLDPTQGSFQPTTLAQRLWGGPKTHLCTRA